MTRSHDLNRLLRVPAGLLALIAPSAVLAGGHYEYAQVLSSQPLYETVSYSVPREQCQLQQVTYQEPGRRSVTGPIVGAIVGGALGNAVGSHKRNKQVGTAVGALLGGSIGADVAYRRSSGGSVRHATEEVCSVVYEQRTEERPNGYRVTYRYGNQTYSTHMDRDPGRTLRVRVHVTPV